MTVKRAFSYLRKFWEKKDAYRKRKKMVKSALHSVWSGFIVNSILVHWHIYSGINGNFWRKENNDRERERENLYFESISLKKEGTRMRTAYFPKIYQIIYSYLILLFLYQICIASLSSSTFLVFLFLRPFYTQIQFRINFTPTKLWNSPNDANRRKIGAEINLFEYISTNNTVFHTYV